VFLKWLIAGSGSVITDVIPLKIVANSQNSIGLSKLFACVTLACVLTSIVTAVHFTATSLTASLLTFAGFILADLKFRQDGGELTTVSLAYVLAYGSFSIIVALMVLLLFHSPESDKTVTTIFDFSESFITALQESLKMVFVYLIAVTTMTVASLIVVSLGKPRPKLHWTFAILTLPGLLVTLYTTLVGVVIIFLES
jgi:hypothetical protein